MGLTSYLLHLASSGMLVGEKLDIARSLDILPDEEITSDNSSVIEAARYGALCLAKQTTVSSFTTTGGKVLFFSNAAGSLARDAPAKIRQFVRGGQTYSEMSIDELKDPLKSAAAFRPSCPKKISSESPGIVGPVEHERPTSLLIRTQLVFV